VQHKNVEDRVERLWTELKTAQTDLVMARERIAKLEAIQSELSSTKERVAKLEADNEWLKAEPVRAKTTADSRGP
jgi:prefoldin subunit 5